MASLGGGARGNGSPLTSPFRLGGLTGDHPPIEAGREGFGFVVSVAFSVNYIMGTGFLTLPFATAKAGILLGLVALAFMTLLANTAKDYVLECSARAELIDHPGSYPELGLQASADGLSSSASLLSRQTSSQNLPLMLTIKQRKYEMPVLCSKFLGSTGRLIYMLCLSIYIYGALLAYTTVFSKSCASTLPIPGVGDSYALYMTLFAVIVVPLSCLELTEQVTVQVVMAFCRVLMVFLMVGTVGAAYATRLESFPGLSGPVGIPLWDWDGLYVFLPIACYAFIYHHSIAGLSHPVRDKKLLGSIFLTTFIVCAVAYGAIAVLVANYFGPDMAQSSNLEWAHYGESPHRNAAARAVAYYILLFPALDVVSSFPLNAITLGNNFLSMRDDGKSGGATAGVTPSRRKVVAFRLLASVPPILVGYFVRDLGRVSEFAGTVGVIITLIFPALLNLKSRQVMKQMFMLDSAKTYYSNELSRKRYGPVNLLIGVAIFLYIFINLLLE